MKKVDFIFRVMILMALLVPWTSWGQGIAPIAGDEIWGHGPTIYINDNGQISTDGKTYSSNVTIQFSDVQDQNEGNWQFGEEIDPDNLPITVFPSQDGRQVTLAVKEGMDVNDITEVKFRIAADNNGGQRKGWIEFGLVAGKIDITDEDVSVSLNFEGNKDSKVYDGKAAKVTSITITKGDYLGTLTNGFTAEFYKKGETPVDNPKDVYMVNGTASAYDVVITIGDNTKGYKGTKTVADAYTITQRDLHINPVADKTITCTIGEGGTFAGSEYFTIAMADGTGDDLITGDDAKIEGNITISKEQATGESVSITLPDGLSVVADNSSNYNADNYKLIWNNGNTYTVKVTAKDFSEDDEGGNISVSFEENGNNKKEYDGDPIPNVIVKDGETTLTQGKDYTVSYKDEKGNTLENVPSDAGKYTVVITGAGNYAKESIEKPYEITKRELTIKINDQTITLPSTEINSEITTGEGGTVTITRTVKNQTVELEGSIKAADTDYTTAGTYQDYLDADGFKLKEGVNVNKNYKMPAEVEAGDLIVKAAPVDWTDEKKAEVTVYVNGEGKIVSSSPELELNADLHRLTIALSKIETVQDWTFSSNATGDQPTLSSTELNEYITWNIQYQQEGNLFVTGKKAFEELPQSVKVKIENDNEEGYLLVTFAKDESTEEPEGDWTDGEAMAELTVYILSTGEIIGCSNEKLVVSDGILPITLDNVDLTDWEYSHLNADDDQPILFPEYEEGSEEDLLYSWSIPSQLPDRLNLTANTGTVEKYAALCNSDGIKVKIENGEDEGHLLLKFEKKQISISKDDITEGGDGDEDGVIDSKFYGEGANVTYDSYAHSLAILKTKDGRTLFAGTDYTVTYTVTEGDELLESLPYHAGTYTATITMQGDYTSTGDIVLEGLTIGKRDLHLAFSIEENAKIEDLNEKLDLTEGLVICTPENLAQNDKLEGVITATFTIGQEPVDGLYPVYPETIHFENTENFNYTDYNISYDYTDLTGIEHQEEITPDEDGDVEIGDGEGEIPADDPIGGIEYVNPETGEGSAGGYYEKKYRLYLAVKDKNSYYVEDAEADYAAEGLELFSRHDKKTTWAGGSFTVWYEHNKVANEGGYRVFIKRGKHADYEEVKLDEVSGYYQIRNVQSDIYVRLYYGTGFPVANEEITATDARAYAQANKIVVITPEPTDVQIISMAGAVVATDQVTGQREFANLAEGVYIVRMGETVIKLQVRN